MPFYAKIVGGPAWGIVPGSVLRVVRGWSGVDCAMADQRLGSKTRGMERESEMRKDR